MELLFAKNVFGETNITVQAQTVIAQHDTGELLQYQQDAFNHLNLIFEKQTDEDWFQTVTTKEFGTKTKAEAIGRIISQTAYHTGQLDSYFEVRVIKI